MFLHHKISILKWFLNDHVTLKTAENSTLPSQEYILFKKYIKVENSYFKCNNFRILMFYCISDQINVASVLPPPDFWMVVYV